MKKYISILLIFVFVISLCGCSPKKENTTSSVESIVSEVNKEVVSEENILNVEGTIYAELDSKSDNKISAYKDVSIPVSYKVPDWMNRKANKTFVFSEETKGLLDTHTQHIAVRIWKNPKNPDVIMCVADFSGYPSDFASGSSNYKYNIEGSLVDYVVKKTLIKLYPSKDDSLVYPNETSIKYINDVTTSKNDSISNKSENFQFTNVFYTRPDEFAEHDYVYATGNVIMHYSTYKTIIFGIDISKDHLYKESIRKITNNIAKTVKISIPANESKGQEG